MSVESNATAIQEALGPVMEDILHDLKVLVRSKDSHPVKYKNLLKIGVKVLNQIIPHTPCAQQCSHCCHMAVVLSEYEASIIAKHTGRRYTKHIQDNDPLTMLIKHEMWIKSYTGKPCPFLKDSKCSIYEVRPSACRNHHTVSDTNECCDLYVRPLAITPSVDLGFLEKAFVIISQNEPFGEIREFFPNET